MSSLPLVICSVCRTSGEYGPTRHCHTRHINGRELKVSLFVDDVDLCLQYPAHFLPVLERLLLQFSVVPGLKINHTKSEIHPIMLTAEQKVTIRSLTSYKWIQTNWRYLGINILLDLTLLYKENFVRQFQELKHLSLV